MTNTTTYVAFDLGAESGRAVLGRFDGEKLSLEVPHRFSNGPTRVHHSLYWNALNLFAEMNNGLAKVSAMLKDAPASVGIDTWGVDFGLLDRAGQLIGLPYHYRDSRTDGLVEAACRIVPREEIFAQTGIQFMQLNTLYQLFALAQQKSPALEIAQTMLMMPDLFNYWFTGQKATEYTIASTSQCFDMQQRTWATSMLEKLGIPTRIFQETVVQPGAQIGTLLPEIAAEAGLKKAVPVIAPAGHDTACAVAAVPVAAEDVHRFAYLSSGTWSLLGVVTNSPIITAQSLRYNFTNEGGVQNTIRLLKNIMGLWLVQESRRTWAAQGQSLTYAELTQLANEAPPFTALIDPEAPAFLAPGDMPARIREFCRQTGQTPPESKGAVIRCALESLALKYRWGVEKLEELTGSPIETVHIVGGGTQNTLLNQFTANATGRPVITGPIEATAFGNILMQMLALGHISSLEEGGQIMRRSCEIATYAPAEQDRWAEAYARFKTIQLA